MVEGKFLTTAVDERTAQQPDNNWTCPGLSNVYTHKNSHLIKLRRKEENASAEEGEGKRNFFLSPSPLRRASFEYSHTRKKLEQLRTTVEKKYRMSIHFILKAVV